MLRATVTIASLRSTRGSRPSTCGCSLQGRRVLDCATPTAAPRTKRLPRATRKLTSQLPPESWFLRGTLSARAVFAQALRGPSSATNLELELPLPLEHA